MLIAREGIRGAPRAFVSGRATRLSRARGRDRVDGCARPLATIGRGSARASVSRRCAARGGALEGARGTRVESRARSTPVRARGVRLTRAMRRHAVGLILLRSASNGY